MLCKECGVIVLTAREARPRRYKKRRGASWHQYVKWNICDGCHRKEIESGAEEADHGTRE